MATPKKIKLGLTRKADTRNAIALSSLPRLLADLKQISDSLNKVFRAAADLKAEISLDDAEEVTQQFPWP